MKTSFLVLACSLTLVACASSSQSTHDANRPQPLEAQLSVKGSGGKLRAKILLKNNTGREIVLHDMDPRFIHVETNDGKPMDTKTGVKNPASADVNVPARGTTETTFNLSDKYSFWDRLTKYKVWYESPEVKSNVAQVWF